MGFLLKINTVFLILKFIFNITFHLQQITYIIFIYNLMLNSYYTRNHILSSHKSLIKNAKICFYSRHINCHHFRLHNTKNRDLHTLEYVIIIIIYGLFYLTDEEIITIHKSISKETYIHTLIGEGDHA